LIAGFTDPHAVHNPHPDVCQSTQGHAVGFPFRQLALVIGSGPRFTESLDCQANW
jgi:hypothetical protein